MDQLSERLEDPNEDRGIVTAAGEALLKLGRDQTYVMGVLFSRYKQDPLHCGDEPHYPVLRQKPNGKWELMVHWDTYLGRYMGRDLDFDLDVMGRYMRTPQRSEVGG